MNGFLASFTLVFLSCHAVVIHGKTQFKPELIQKVLNSNNRDELSNIYIPRKKKNDITHVSLHQLLESLQSTILFFVARKNKMNLDAMFGVRAVEGMTNFALHYLIIPITFLNTV